MDWINTKKRLPETEQIVDVWVSKKETRYTNVIFKLDDDVGFFVTTKNRYTIGNLHEWSEIYVSHWMPVPKPPRNKNEKMR